MLFKDSGYQKNVPSSWLFYLYYATMLQAVSKHSISQRMYEKTHAEKMVFSSENHITELSYWHIHKI